MTAVFGAALLLLVAASDQGPVPTSTDDPAPQRLWTVAAGRQATSIRDITRSGIPLDTSPVSLGGHGVFAAARYERRGARASQSVSAGWARASALALETPSFRLPMRDDRVRRLDIRYEYQRFFWRDNGIRGLRLGAGPVALGAWQVVERHPSLSNTIKISDLEAGGGGVVSARLARWERVTIDAAWTTALVIGGVSEDNEPAITVRERQSGGGWLLQGRVAAAVRLTPGLWLSAGYTSLGQARFASHRGQSDRHARLEVGVTHVR
jgi:hypothetical protein